MIKEFLKPSKWKVILALVPSVMYVLAGFAYSYLISLAMNGVSESLIYPLAIFSSFFIHISSFFTQIPMSLLGTLNLIAPIKLSISAITIINFIFIFIAWYLIFSAVFPLCKKIISRYRKPDFQNKNSIKKRINTPISAILHSIYRYVEWFVR